MKIIFMGTPEFSTLALQNLIDSEHDVIAVYSQPPRPKGRGQQVQKSPIHLMADSNNIPVFTPLSFKKDPEAVAQFQSLNADIAVVAAYGLILPQIILDAPKLGCLNIHASLLPRWRGASPIQHAIWKGDKVSGVTIMQMELGLDTGPMLFKREIELTKDMTAQKLHDDLSRLGAEMIIEVLKNIPPGEKQNDAESVYAPMLKKEDGLIDWTQKAADIDRQVRALNPWPGTYSLADGRRLKILKGEALDKAGQGKPGSLSAKGEVSCGSGVYKILNLQPENAKAMDTASAFNGKYLSDGMVLGS